MNLVKPQSLTEYSFEDEWFGLNFCSGSSIQHFVTLHWNWGGEISAPGLWTCSHSSKVF